MDAHRATRKPLTRGRVGPVSVSVVIGLALVSLLGGAPTKAAESLSTDQVLDAFLETCREAGGLEASKRDEVLELVAARREKGRDLDSVIADALRVLFAEFAAALDALDGNDVPRAILSLHKLAASENRYLAAESSCFLARAHFLKDDFEEALPVLKRVLDEHAEHTLNLAEAKFLRGVCEARLLRRLDAITSLGEFLAEHPNAPARMRAVAEQNLEFLDALEVGSIDDALEHMEFAQRKLSREQTDGQTQEVQEKIVAMLSSLIEEIEKCSGKCAGCGCCAGGKKSGSGQGGNVPGVSRGTSTAARRIHQSEPGSSWADLRNKARDARAFAAMKSQFPARYRQLIEQYYRSLQEEDEESTPY